ncbi:hypothetical protein NSP_13280 [Nodularia spumigena CCY9414]|nr:hypothetical protein NSP_13280 [Nodularia spumigena CCY9414]
MGLVVQGLLHFKSIDCGANSISSVNYALNRRLLLDFL